MTGLQYYLHIDKEIICELLEMRNVRADSDEIICNLFVVELIDFMI